MYTIDDIKVKLLNEDEIGGFIKNHGTIACICYDTDDEFSEKVGESCMTEGHMSGSRGDYFKFEIEAPRFTLDQLFRHELGVFKNMQSQRYVDMDNDFSIFVPKKVYSDEKLRDRYKLYEDMCKYQYQANRDIFNDLGIKGEKANDLMRTMLPIGVKSKARIGFTLEALIHFCHKRLCVRSDAPIVKVAKLIRDEVVKVQPKYKDLLIPQCEHLMYCPEKHGCKKYPSRIELENLINKEKENTKIENDK